MNTHTHDSAESPADRPGASEAAAPTGRGTPAPGLRRPDVYTLHLGEKLGPEWSDWMEELEILNRNDGSGMLTARIPDQARLFGLLLKVRDLRIPLLGLYPASSLDPVAR